MRNVEINISEKDIENMSNEERQKLEAAICHLATWAMYSERYSHCYIYPDRKLPDLIAVYFKGPAQPGSANMTFQMGAVWRADRKEYSFHS